MTYKTYAQMKAKIERDWDLEEEEMVGDTELMEYFNDAISEAEATMVGLGVDKKYFERPDYLALVEGTSDYDLPSTIFASKITSIVYNNGNDVYEIKSLRGPQQYLNAAVITNQNDANPVYRYKIINQSSAGVKIRIYPAAKETSSTNVTIWNIRSATKMTSSASICDIPESYNFIYAHVAWRILGKDGDPRAGAAANEREKQKQLMIETLETMVDDGDNEIAMDTTIYEEMS